MILLQERAFRKESKRFFWHSISFSTYAESMKVLLENMAKAVLAELIVMLLPCMVFWFHTGNSRGLAEEGRENGFWNVQIEVDHYRMNVENFLIHMISVDYQPNMEEEALKALAVAERSHLYAYLSRYRIQQQGEEDSESSSRAESKKERQKMLVSAEKLGVSYHTPGQMVYSLRQTAEKTGEDWFALYETIKKAVQDTSGHFLTDLKEESGEKAENGSEESEKKSAGFSPVDVPWHAVSAGKTRFYAGNRSGQEDGISLNCPQLKAMEGKDRDLAQAVTIRLYTRRELAKRLWEIPGTEDILEEKKTLSSCITIEKRDNSGYIEELSIGSRRMTGEEAAELLTLSSGCFYIFDLEKKSEADQNAAELKIVTFGSGTGYGMSLAGASVMAAAGADYKEILEYYFPVCQLE